MSNRHNFLVPTDFEDPGKHNLASTTSTSESNSRANKRELASVGTSWFAKCQMIKSRQLVVGCGIAGMLGWLFVFGMGMLVNSKPYREQLASSFDWKILAKALITFTPTNVAVLAMLAGFLGGCASLMMYSDYDSGSAGKQNGKALIDEERLTYLRENPICSALRGFVVYLTFLAGTVFGANGAFATTTQDQYCRLAGAVAVLAFGVGYDPTVFRQLTSLVARRADTGARSNQLKPEADPLLASISTKQL